MPPTGTSPGACAFEVGQQGALGVLPGDAGLAVDTV